MISLQRETLFDIIDEVEPLLAMHHAEMSANQDKIKLNPRWHDYAALERLERFYTFTARDNEKLIGYAGMFLDWHMHHNDIKVATNDVLFVHPDHRGVTGVRLIKFCETSMKALGAGCIVWAARPQNNLYQLLERLGYQVEEVKLSKLI